MQKAVEIQHGKTLGFVKALHRGTLRQDLQEVWNSLNACNSKKE